MKILGLILLSIFFPLAGLASSPDSDLNDLKRLLANRLFPLDRDMITFRYEFGDFNPQNLEQVQDHVSAWPQRFFDVTKTGDRVGPGSYQAIDPAASRTFGTYMLVFHLAKGSLWLNALGDLDQHEADTFRRIQQNGCGGDQNQVSLFIDAFGALRNSQNLDCRELIIKAVRELKVEAIIYPWLASRSLTDCRPDRGAAVSVIDKSAIRQDLVTFYSDQRVVGDGRLTQSLARTYHEASRDFSLQFSKPSAKLKIMASMGEHSSAEPPTSIKDHLAFCGREWSFEKGRSSLAAPLDLEINALLVRAKRAVENRNPSLGYFDPRRVRALEDQLFSASGLPSDRKAQWLQAKDLIDSYDPQKDESILPSLLSETFTPPVSQNLWAGQLQEHVGRPSFYRVVAGLMGFGPRATQIFVYNYKIPAGDIPPLFALSESPGLQAEREIYRQILDACVGIYERADISWESIQNGRCGLRQP